MSPRLSDLLLNAQSDARLLSLVRGGNERAFAAIVERYRRELFALARRLHPDGRAEDLLQQTFLSAFAALRSGAEVEHLRAWLYQILRNAAARASSCQEAEVELDPDVIPGDSLEEAVQQRMLAFSAFAEIAALPSRQRDALVATAIHGQSRAAIAGSMGISEGAVRQLVHRARATLRSAVTAVTPWPLASWIFAAPEGSPADRLPELLVGAGAASVGGATVKLGALAASAVVATGLLTAPLNVSHSHRSAIPGGARSADPMRPAVVRANRVGPSAPTALFVRAASRAAAAGPTQSGPREGAVGQHSGLGVSRPSGADSSGGGDHHSGGGGGRLPERLDSERQGGDTTVGESRASRGGQSVGQQQPSESDGSNGDGGGSGGGTGPGGATAIAGPASATGGGGDDTSSGHGNVSTSGGSDGGQMSSADSFGSSEGTSSQSG